MTSKGLMPLRGSQTPRNSSVGPVAHLRGRGRLGLQPPKRLRALLMAAYGCEPRAETKELRLTRRLLPGIADQAALLGGLHGRR